MEKTAGRVLLRRTNPVAPTESGKIVLRAARHSAYIHRDMVHELDGPGNYRTVPIAVNADSLTTWFLPVLRTLALEDRVLCDIYREGEQYSSALLRSGEVMAAITSNPEHIPGCSVQKLGTVRYRVVASTQLAERAFPRLPHLSVGELCAVPYIEYDRKDDDQSIAWELLARQGVSSSSQRAPVLYVPSSPDYARLIYAGVGWGTLPEAQCAERIKKGELVALAKNPLEFPLYWQRWNMASPALEALSNRVLEATSSGTIY